MNTSGNLNHTLSIYGRWIYDFNYKIVLSFIKYLLDIICSLSKDDKGMHAEFGDVFYSFRYVNPKKSIAKA